MLPCDELWDSAGKSNLDADERRRTRMRVPPQSVWAGILSAFVFDSGGFAVIMRVRGKGKMSRYYYDYYYRGSRDRDP